MFYRLIKPEWAQELLANKKPNKKFIKAVPGPNTIEGCGYTSQYLTEKNQAGYNIYFFPNHPSTNVYQGPNKIHHLNGRAIDVFNYVFVDMDLKDGVYPNKEAFYKRIKEFPLPPTRVVDSGHGVHVYWAVSDLTVGTYLCLQRALLKYFQTDESVWTVLQLMRSEGYLNTKDLYNPILAPVIPQLCNPNNRYSTGDFPSNIIMALNDLDREKMNRHLGLLSGSIAPPDMKDVDLDALPDSFIRLIAENDYICDLFLDPAGTFGDRSAADFKLGHLLLKHEIPRLEAYQVMCNTQKALEKGPAREVYANCTLEKIYVTKAARFKTVAQRQSEDPIEINEDSWVRGPLYLDHGVLNTPWKKQGLLGVIAGSGVGKTDFALMILCEIISNNPDRDEVYIFFSIEMPESDIQSRWASMTADKPTLGERLYVVGNIDENGDHMPLGMQEFYNITKEIEQAGKKVGAIVIDHMHIISTHIDTRLTPTFGGDIKKLEANDVANQLKTLAKLLNVFTIVLSQTTKAQGKGDLPLEKSACYGISQFEWIMDHIITIWRPLMRVAHRSPISFTAWQYAKIRETHGSLDKVKCYQPFLLTFNPNTKALTRTTKQEYDVFARFAPMADDARKDAEKGRAPEYQIKPEGV